LLCSPFCQPCTSLFSSIFPFCCSHLWPPTLSTIVVCYLGSYLTKKVVVSHYRYLGNQLRFCFVIVSKSHMVDAKPYLTFLCQITGANLHVLLINSILSYQPLWHTIFLFPSQQ
jgi:hypothetical protein